MLVIAYNAPFDSFTEKVAEYLEVAIGRDFSIVKASAIFEGHRRFEFPDRNVAKSTFEPLNAY
jgi:hypothetical protein